MPPVREDVALDDRMAATRAGCDVARPSGDRDRRRSRASAPARSVRTPHQHPAARHATRNATWPTTGPADGDRAGRRGAAQLDAVPQRREPRHRLQPVGQLARRGRTCPRTGTAGTMPMRMMTANADVGLLGRPRSAVSGAANAERAEHRGRDREHAPRRRHAAEDARRRSRKTVADSATRTRDPQRRGRRTASPGPIGVATIAWYVPHPLHAAHAPATATRPRPLHRALAAIRPGATNTR